MHYFILILGIICYLASLFLPVFVWSHPNPQVEYGYQVLVSGWIGIFGLVLGWYSNPLALMSLFCLLIRDDKKSLRFTPIEYPSSPNGLGVTSDIELANKSIRLAKIYALWAVILSSSSWFVTHNGNFRLLSFGLGFYLWNLSIYLICGFVFYTAWKKEESVRTSK